MTKMQDMMVKAALSEKLLRAAAKDHSDLLKLPGHLQRLLNYRPRPHIEKYYAGMQEKARKAAELKRTAENSLTPEQKLDNLLWGSNWLKG